MTIKILVIISTIFLSQLSFAGRFLIPPAEESLVLYQPVESKAVLQNDFSLLVWNVHKGKDEQAWVEDVKRLSLSSDVFLLQEAMDDSLMSKLFGKDLGNFEWFFAKSFSYTKTQISSGVATGATTESTKTLFHRTTDTEPIIGTPKTTMVSFYKLADGQDIAILNIHGLNRTSNAAFYRQIDESLALVKNHNGPIVYAGDFNTNNKKKFAELIKRMDAYGLKRISYPVDERKNQLDWIFYRGCTVTESEILYNYQTSDHAPLRARLNCN